MRFTIPIKLPSLANLRWHWRKIAELKKSQREATVLAMRDLVLPPPPLVVTLTRLGRGKLDDDNLAGACKYVRDAIAAKVGIDDGSDRYTWIYLQVKGDYRVDVEIVTRPS